MRGLPTVLITVSPEASAQMGPPRALYPAGFAIGHVLGGPNQPDLQRAVLRDALQRLVTPGEPGTIEERIYPQYVPPPTPAS